MSVLVVAEHLDGKVQDITYEVISAARDLEDEVILAVVGQEPRALDLRPDGVDTVVLVEVEALEFENDIYQVALERLLTVYSPRAVLLGFTVNSMGYASAVAAKHNLGFASDVVAIGRTGEELTATRTFYGGKVFADLDFPAGRPALLLLRPRTWPIVEGQASPKVVTHHLGPVKSRARHRAFRQASRGDIDITAADFLLAVGRGVGKEENLATFEQLAARLGATLAVSRPIVDAGWASNTLQVGQSGNTVKPKVYLAFGISGAVQHLAGMKSSELIIAVNTDPDAAIFDVAHYGATTDLFETACELMALL